VIDSLSLSIAVYAAGVACWAAARGLRGRAPSRGLLGSAIVLETALILQALLRLGALIGGHRPAQLAVALGYLVAGVTILPLTIGPPGSGAPSEQGSSLALAIGAAALAVVSLRTRPTWA
jgi:hypothetical protein